MEVSGPKIYDIHLVINSTEVDGIVTKVLCVETWGSRMFLGTAEGHLLEYFITDEKSKTFFSRVRQIYLNRGQPVVQIRNASALDTLITLAGGTLAMCDSQSLEPKGNNISGVICFTVDENPLDGDPFSVSICYAKKKSIFLAQASEKGFNTLKEISLDAMAVSLSIECGLCCVALASGRYVFVNTSAQRKSVQDLCEFDPREVTPKVVHVGKEEFLVIGPGGLGVFVTSRGTSERPPIIWSEKVSQLAVDGLNVVAVGNDAIYVSSLSDPGTSNLIPFPAAKCLAVSEGRLYVGTARSLYRFMPISVDAQVEALLSSDKIEQAFSLLEMAHLRPDRKEFLFRKIHKRAVFHRLAEYDLEGCKESIYSANIDLREVLSLFPGILPSSTTFTRAVPPVHDYVDVNQMTKNDHHMINTISGFVLEILTTDEGVYQSKDLSTATLKLAAKYSKPRYILLLDDLNNGMSVDFDDCFEWMDSNRMFDCAALLHKARGEIQQALDKWIRLLTKEISCGECDEFKGIDAIIETLLSSNDEQLVWSYYHKLSKIDADQALDIFTRRNPSPVFQPLEVAEKLSANRAVCRKYLNHCVTVKKLEDEDLHTFLATLYIDEILASPGAANISQLQEEFRQFLIESNCLKVQFLIGKLSNSKLRLELSILHGKAGDHAPALKIIVDELGDHKFAREYCKKIHDKKQREDTFVHLFKIYLNQSSGEAGLSKECADVLMDFVEEFDISSLLPLFPDDLGLTIIGNVLQRAVRIKTHKERQIQLMKGLSQRVYNDYKVAMHDQNQGYQLDEESVCGVCWRKLPSSEQVLHNRGLVVHSKCV